MRSNSSINYTANQNMTYITCEFSLLLPFSSVPFVPSFSSFSLLLLIFDLNDKSLFILVPFLKKWVTLFYKTNSWGRNYVFVFQWNHEAKKCYYTLAYTLATESQILDTTESTHNYSMLALIMPNPNWRGQLNVFIHAQTEFKLAVLKWTL